MNNHKKMNVVVVGGGGAGIMAALIAAESGAAVTLLERMEKPGKKILVCGNGRCNITNMSQDPARFHGAPAAFTDAILRAFTVQQTLAFFDSIGLPCVEEEMGRVYPTSGQAATVLAALRYEMDRRNVRVMCGADAVRLVKKGAGFAVETKDGPTYEADRVIMAAGGKAGPQYGSIGTGLEMVRALGHKINPVYPVLVMINLDSPYLKEMDGVRFEGSASVICQGKVMREESGEIQITDYGISGIPALDLSRAAGECVYFKREAKLEMRLLPRRTAPQIGEDVRHRLASRPDETLERALTGIVHMKLIPPLIKAAGFKNQHIPCRQAPEPQARALAALLHKWAFPITGTQDWTRAHVTAGGVDASEINPATMESKRVPGLYLIGEIVDVDGDCGGYNLQWAWSSGALAGRASAK
ncbi:MAG: NAD(P)/FAD-dependent oxidoreductase [Elusimicrobia bacterium]|nr:NAD(P)/FAD-dependent oxidoreductase [Elusimicrobiota bacterium]